MVRSLYARLRQKLGPRCEYCQTSIKITGESNTIDHIIPTARGGTSDEGNLCIACRHCNETKSAQIEAIDPETNERVALFNPRKQLWQEHFTWANDGTLIIGQTANGRATIVALQMNHQDIVNARRLWVSVGWHPPKEI